SLCGGSLSSTTSWRSSCVFFFQAEDGIRDFHVTGVQTCALPILILLGRFEEAQKERKSLDRYNTPILRVAKNCFDGLFHERKANDAAAKSHFEKVIAEQVEMQYVKEYHAMAYAGLASISDSEGDK